jgi:hypothetical protein
MNILTMPKDLGGEERGELTHGVIPYIFRTKNSNEKI